MEYVVACGRYRFFYGFSNGVPQFTTRIEYAMRFDYEEMAQHVAKRCHKYSGRNYKVVSLDEEE